MLFHDVATSLIWAKIKVSFGVGKTLMAKECFEQWLWELTDTEIHHLHSDNGIFNTEFFDEDSKNKFQTQSFSEFGAHHQNALAERSIQTIMYMARIPMVHVSLYWIKYGANNLAIWGFSVKHAVWLQDCITRNLSGLTPIELLTKIKGNHCYLLCTHV